MKRRWTALYMFLLSMMLLSAAPLPAAGEKVVIPFKEISIGVLAERSSEICRQRWQPLADYLDENFHGKKFKIVPLSFEQVEAAVAERKIEFILVNPVIYINLEVKYKVSRIMTMIREVNGRFLSELGGVIFYRVDSGNFDKCTAVQSRSVTAVSQTSLGGYLAVLLELQDKSVAIEHGLDLRFVGSQDKVVYDVLARKSVFGIVRTGILEKMDAEGRIDIKKLAVIYNHSGGQNHLPFNHSTRAYPEWPLAKLMQTNSYLADRVAIILLSLQPVDEAAVKAGIGGFTTPLSYEPVRVLLQTLKQPPYEHQGEISFLQVLRQYYHYAVAMMILTFLVIGSIIVMAVKNNHIRVMQTEQQSIIEKLHLAEADAEARRFMAQELLDAVPLPVFYLDSRSNFRGCNYAFEEFSGFSRNELRGESGVEFSLVNGISVITEEDKGLLCEAGLKRREFEFTDAAGNQKIYEQWLSTYFNHEQSVGLIGVFNDLTDHKLLTTRMIQLSTVVEQAAESIVVTDPQGNIQYVNPAFEKITGYTQAEAEGVNPRILKSGRQDDAYYKELWETLARGETWRGEFVNKRKDETLYDEYAVIFPIRDDAGEIISLAAVKRDITKEKAMQSQLRTSQRLEAVGQLAAGVAHELNTPIGFVSSNFESVIGYLNKFVELIAFYRKAVAELAGKLPDVEPDVLAQTAAFEEDLQIEFMLEDLDDLFTESRDGFERISSIVTKLREFSRIDQIGDQESFNFNHAIETTLVVARNEYKHSAEIELYLDPELPDVMASGGEINQVILNLILNAVQAIKGQGRSEPGKIVISTTFDDKWVRCLVADDGPGIKPEYLERIFDPFFTTKPVGEGTGLGLNISYDIITNKHKGSLVVESAPGEGATFFIALPRRQTTS